jgi:ABC-type nitrate/sulfonate/bicarbonate transport system substrate-binding protein
MRAIVLILLLALVAAACGGDADTTTTAGDDGATTTAGDDGTTTTAGGDDGTTTTAAPEVESLTVAIANLRSIQYFPVYLAHAAGYFEDEGLDIGEIEIISGSGAAVQQLIAGNIDVMIANPAAAISAVAGEQGDLVTYCSTHYQNIFTLATPTSTGITDVAGLEGGTIGVSEPSGGEVPVVRAALATAGLVDGEDYELLAIGEGGQLTFESLSNGDATAYSSSVFDVAAVEAQGLALTHILPDEFKYVPSIGYSVTRETFDARSEALTRFARATARAYAWGSLEENRDQVNELIEPYNAELFEDPAFVDAVWDATLTLMTPPADMADPQQCQHYIPGWETYVAAALETPVEEGGLAGEVDIPSMADESLVPAINDFAEEDIAPPSAG